MCVFVFFILSFMPNYIFENFHFLFYQVLVSIRYALRLVKNIENYQCYWKNGEKLLPCVKWQIYSTHRFYTSKTVNENKM